MHTNKCLVLAFLVVSGITTACSDGNQTAQSQEPTESSKLTSPQGPVQVKATPTPHHSVPSPTPDEPAPTPTATPDPATPTPSATPTPTPFVDTTPSPPPVPTPTPDAFALATDSRFDVKTKFPNITEVTLSGSDARTFFLSMNLKAEVQRKPKRGQEQSELQKVGENFTCYEDSPIQYRCVFRFSAPGGRALRDRKLKNLLRAVPSAPIKTQSGSFLKTMAQSDQSGFNAVLSIPTGAMDEIFINSGIDFAGNFGSPDFRLSTATHGKNGDKNFGLSLLLDLNTGSVIRPSEDE